ncbi:hypothetical protein [Planktothricoides raciborskii]|nr:hypothetical protein [Planktothricoides raciborskii]
MFAERPETGLFWRSPLTEEWEKETRFLVLFILCPVQYSHHA